MSLGARGLRADEREELLKSHQQIKALKATTIGSSPTDSPAAQNL